MWTRRSRRPRPGALCCRKRNDGHLPHRTYCFNASIMENAVVLPNCSRCYPPGTPDPSQAGARTPRVPAPAPTRRQFHHAGNKIVIKEHYWNCPDTGQAGNAIDFLMKIRSVTFNEAMTMLSSGPMDHNGGGCGRSEKGKQEEKDRHPPKTVVSASIHQNKWPLRSWRYDQCAVIRPQNSTPVRP